MNEMNLANIIQGKPLYKSPEIKDLRHLLKLSEKRFGNYTAFKFRKKPNAQIESRTYSQFDSDVDAFGSALVNMGLLDSRVAIIGENRYEWVVSYLATVNGVGIAIPLDRMLPPNELEAMLERSEADILVYSAAFHDVVENILKNNNNLKAVICMNEDEDTLIDDPRFYSFQKLLNTGHNLLREGYDKFTGLTIDSSAMRILLFTSGTSSASKAVMLSHKNICADIMGLGGIVYCKPGEVIVSMLPLHHTFENTCGLLFPLYLGMTIAISDGLKYLSKNLTEYKPDLLVGVPLIYDKFKKKVTDEIEKRGQTGKVKALMSVASFLSHIGLDFRRKLFKRILDSFGGKLRVIVTGGAAMDPETAQWFENIGVKVYQGYGLTETSPVVAGGNDRRRKIGTCGEPLPGVKLAVLNPDDNGYGELVVQGDNVMLGYWKDEEATREALKGGWFHTGDLGYIKRGLIHVTGRLKSMIVLKNGKKVFPEEIESHINSLGFVKESIVWGETAKDGTVEICSKIVLDKEQVSEMLKTNPDDENAIRKLLDAAIKEINKLMPAYKTIRYYVFSYQELIKTTSLKAKRYIETANIRTMLNKMALNMKNLAGKNIDKLMEMMSKRVEEF
ncbi:MAG: long-chain fatty acid--CoA ligase [Clostridiaceae bacterium]|nr:long-chain fatty acid--CoA ligase [Clostridiaceae bacterium]